MCQYCETKQFRRKIVNPPLCLSYPLHLTIPGFNETLKVFPAIFCGTVTKKIFRRKSFIHPLCLKKIFTAESNETIKHSPKKLFGPVRQKIFDGKLFYSPLLSIKVFDTRIYWKNKGLPYENFRLCETQKVRRKIFIHHIILKVSPYLKVMKH